MSDIKKFLDGGQKVNNLNIPVDIQKDSEHQRIVVGFATLDNVDLTNDVITAEASMKAFEDFRGNVRLMHDKLHPVGKVVDFAPATYFDPKTNKEYQGIQVAVRISESEDGVWQKCLDGTLNGFSVGGRTISMAPEYRADIDKTVQVIKEYQLTELSLVDSPANHLANVQTIYKSIDGDPEVQNMHLFGEIQKVFEISTKGDYPQMPEENVQEAVAEVNEVETEAPVAETEAAPEVAAEEAVTEAPKPSLEEVIAQLSEQINAQSEKVSESVSKSLALQIDDVKKEFDSRFATLQEDAQKRFDGPIADLAAKISKIEEGITLTEKRLDAINENTAIQKSLDAETPKVLEPTDDNPFAGVFSNRYE